MVVKMALLVGAINFLGLTESEETQMVERLGMILEDR
jgi:hypothetical protein